MIEIKCKNKAAESLFANELSKYKNLEIKIIKESFISEASSYSAYRQNAIDASSGTKHSYKDDETTKNVLINAINKNLDAASYALNHDELSSIKYHIELILKHLTALDKLK